MSESVGATAPTAPSPSGVPTAEKKKRSRPSKAQRQAARDKAGQAVPAQPQPTTGLSKVEAAKSFAQAARNAPVESSAPSFRPGSFPTVFNASAPEASVDVWFTPDIPKVSEHAEFALDALQSSDGFVEFLANAGVTSEDAAAKFESHFEAATIMCAAQSICHAHQTAGFPVGDFAPVLGSDLVHLRSVRQIMAQYGDVRFDRVGQRYSVKHYSDTVKAFIRQAKKAFTASSRGSRIAQRSCWWLPTSRGDSRTRFILAIKVAELIKGKDVGFIPNVDWLESKILQTGATPPAWISSVLSEAEVKILEPLWQAYPATATAFRQAFSKEELLDLLGLTWSSPTDADLWWGVDYKSQASLVLDAWAARAPALRKFFEVADKAISTGCAGSTAQIGSSSRFRGVHISSFALDNGTAISSLAAAFMPQTLFAPDKESAVTYTTTAPVGERAVAWVQRDFR